MVTRRRIFFSLLGGVVITCALVFTQISSAEEKSFTLSAIDTVAGYGTQIRVSPVSFDETVEFTVLKPDNTSLSFSESGNAHGEAILFLDEFHTRLSGVYSVKAQVHGEIATSQFIVFSGDVSLEKSSLKSDQLLASADGTDQIQVDIILIDDYGNPIPQHEMNLVSSRAQDHIIPMNNRTYTDENGLLSFLVSSSQEGISSISAYDLSLNTILEKRLKLVFTDTFALDSTGGDDSLLLALETEDGFLDHFTFADFPDSLGTNDDISFSVSAVDKSEKTIGSYLGTIHFSVKGDNASSVKLPQDYTFTPEDLGKHTFSLGLSFAQNGEYTLEVRDLKNKDIIGTMDVLVGMTSSTPVSNSSSLSSGSSKNIIIKSPTEGTYSTNVQTISGTATPGIDVRIFDNNEEIGTKTADAKGIFSFTTAPLSDGNHVFYLTMVDNKGTILGTSSEVKVSIDTNPATVEKLELSPADAVAPGSMIEATLTSESGLSKVSLVLEKTIFDLESTLESPTLYKGSFQSPTKPGDYSLDVILKDQLGNEQLYKEQAVLKVSADVKPSVIGTSAPSQVSGVTAYPSNQRVTLVWDAATDDTGVKSYRVYYGTSPDALSEVVNTFDSSTTWYIPNLQNGKEYFFGVTAVDVNENESSAGSVVVSSIPLEGVASTLSPLSPAAPTVVITTPAVYGGTGPETGLFFLFGFTGTFSHFSIRRLAKKR